MLQLPVSPMCAQSILIAAGLAGAIALSGCTTDSVYHTFSTAYDGVTDAGYRIPPVPTYKLDRKYLRQIVPYQTNEKPGTIIVDTRARFLYFALADGKAVRYGIGIGKQGFEWHGTAHVAMKRE